MGEAPFHAGSRAFEAARRESLGASPTSSESLRHSLKGQPVLATADTQTVAAILDAIGIPTFMVQVPPGGGFRFVCNNARHEEMTGVSRVLLEGRAPEDLFDSELANSVNARYGVCVARRRRIEYDEKLDLPAGERWWHTVLTPLFDEHGRLVRILGTAIDITHHVETEQALRASERRFRDLIEGSIQGICIHRNYRPLFVNPSYARIYGFDKPERVLALDSLLDTVPPDLRKASQHTWDRMSRGEFDSVRTRMEGVRRDGRRIWVDVQARSVNWMGEPAVQLTVVDVTDQRLLEEELRRQAATDPLTGLNNRRQFLVLAEQQIRRSRRTGESLAVLIADLDRFKRINDRRGHGAGDEVLCKAAEIMRGVLRESDINCRWGGEEFAALLVGADRRGAIDVAERLREAWERTDVPFDGRVIRFTGSVGVATLRPKSLNLDRAFQRADRALYRAKEGGRNRVEVARLPAHD